MTAGEVITRIKQEIRQSTTDDDRFSSTDLLNVVNEGYVDFCRYTEILETVSTSVMSSLTSLVSLPANFIDARQFRWSYNRPLYTYSSRKLDYNEQAWKTEVGTPDAVVFTNWSAIRTKPITSAAGTITMKYSYIPTALTTSDEPSFLKSFHDALVSFGAAECFFMMKDIKNGNIHWKRYFDTRKKARSQAHSWQRTPDTMLSQRPVSVFNYPYWDNRFRSKAGPNS